jgi:hypothetical protein
MNDELAGMELLRRMDAATDLIAFTEYTFPWYQTERNTYLKVIGWGWFYLSTVLDDSP